MYRHNDDDMNLKDEINDLKVQMSNNRMNSDQHYNVKLTTRIVGGILGFLFLTGGFSYGCNHEDNSTKREVAKMCPAISPILAVGLTKQKE